MESKFYSLQSFQVPQWAKHLHNKPRQIVKLSNLNTPIHKWNLPDLPDGVTVHIKRDDLTGAELSGNKVRPLQILFAEALEQGVKHVVTGGGPQSGHCRAVSLICRCLGLIPHIVIEGVHERERLGTQGNTLLYRLAGSKIYLAPGKNYESFTRQVRKMREYISEKYNEPCYCIPVGGAAVSGLFAFISAFDELIAQGLHERFDDIVVTIATGGTALGLAVGNYLTGSKLRIHAVTISLTKEELYANQDKLLQQLGMDNVKASGILDIIEGYVGDGYGTATQSGLEFITKISSSTGILLDPYYTGKGAMGMVNELTNNPERFKGKRILFIHTGGIFGLFNGEMDRVLNLSGSVTNDITEWKDEAVSPIV